jgi:signal transduction histidine kinase
VDSADRFPDGQRLLSRLSACAAHDLNNLIAISAGHVYLLRQPGAEFEESLRALDAASSQLERLSRNLGRLGLIEGLPRRPISVNALVERAAARNEQRRLRLDLAERLPEVPGNENDLSAALDCLIENGAEAGEPGQEVRVSTRPEPGGAAVLVSVEDSGRGIPPQIAERIFDPFFSTKPGRGAGLGLFLVAAVAAAHGTSCRIEPRPNGGTTACLRLPVPPGE